MRVNPYTVRLIVVFGLFQSRTNKQRDAKEPAVFSVDSGEAVGQHMCAHSLQTIIALYKPS